MAPYGTEAIWNKPYIVKLKSNWAWLLRYKVFKVSADRMAFNIAVAMLLK